MNDKLLELPFEIQAILAIGYLGYRLATTGLNKHHRTGDFVLQVMVYGAVAKFAQDLAWQWGVGYWSTFGAALLVTLAAAASWRAFGNNAAVTALRALKVTRENYSPSTWVSIINQRRAWKYVSVLLDDGTYLESNIDALPDGLPYETLDVDNEGNLAIYLTERTDPDGTVTEFDESKVLDEYGRAHLTYIPASRIKRVTLGLETRRPTSSAVAGAEETAAPRAAPD